MSSIKTTDLFDVKNFAHKKLFEASVYPWEVLKNLNAYLMEQKLGKIETKIPEGAYLVDPELISIGKGTVVEPGAYIKGPCIIGENCQIRQGAYIRGNVIVGDGSVVGHVSELKSAILLIDAHAAHFAYVGDSILGNRVNLGAGNICANLRLDHSEIFVEWNGEKLSTGTKKLGAILGDDTQLGCNSVANPGTITGKGVKVSPCINFGGFIPENSILKMKERPLVVAK